MLIVIMVIVIPSKIAVSFHIDSNPAPFSIIAFSITINHRGGIIAERYCRIFGMFSIGKINPDIRTVGSMRATNEMSMATIWLFTSDEISIPIDSASVI